MVRIAAITAGLAALVIAASPARAWNPFRTAHGDVEEGNERLQEGQPGDALKAYEEAREDIPEQAALHFDIGLASYALGEYGAAVTALERALERTDDALKPAVLKALGTAYAAWAQQAEESEEDKALAADRWEKSVHFMERALRYAPDDEGLLRNFELALMRFDPPCRARDDEYEQNDGAGGAVPAPFPEGQQELDIPLKSCPEDEDWFVVPLEEGDRLFAEISTETEGAALGLALTTPDGGRQIRPPAETEKPVTTIAYQEGKKAGDLRLRIRNLNDEEADYRLKVRRLPACARLEDGFEDNDTAAAAHVVTGDDAEKLQQLRLCPQDDDWFAVDVGEGDSLVAMASFELEKGSGTLAVADAEGRILLEREATPPAEADASSEEAEGQGGTPVMLTLLEPPPGRYLLRVSGSLDVEAAYSLQAQVVPPCPDGDDGQEDNDFAGDAKEIQPGQPQLLRVCPGDDDWYRLTATKEQRLAVSIVFDHDRGDLDLELYEEGAEEPLAESRKSTSQAGAEAVMPPAVEEETSYDVRVFGPGGAQNFYLLSIQNPEGQGQQNQQQEQQQSESSEDEQKQQDQQPQEQPEPQAAPEPDREQRDPMQQQMDELDRNPRNLEAERARKASPFRHSRPTRPW